MKNSICVLLVVFFTTILLMCFISRPALSSNLSEPENPFEKMYSKKVIIRDDDVDARNQRDPSICLKWLTNFTIEKNTKVTYGLMVGNETFSNNMELVDYLNNLDKTRFEIAAHGYTHEHFKGMSYNEQYSLIENATKTIENYLHIKPYTFITPYHDDDENTSKVCEALGYHSFSSGRAYPNDNVVDFKMDKCLEYNWSQDPPPHYSFEELKQSFDNFYLSHDEYYVFVMHHHTFLDKKNGTMNQTLVNDFEDFIEYMKTKDVEFIMMEEAYEWYVDKDRITYSQTDNSYIIDLEKCEYNHTIKFRSPKNWHGKKIIVFDTIANNVVGEYDANCFEFTGVKGRCYKIYIKNGNIQHYLGIIIGILVTAVIIIGVYHWRKKLI